MDKISKHFLIKLLLCCHTPINLNSLITLHKISPYIYPAISLALTISHVSLARVSHFILYSISLSDRLRIQVYCQ